MTILEIAERPHDFAFWVEWAATNFSSWIVKALPMLLMCAVSAIISVHLQIRQKKVIGKAQATWAAVIAFTLGYMAGNIASVAGFSESITRGIAVATTIFGRDVINWVFANQDAILTGVAGFFKIKIKRNK